jgi:protein O-GlcNAc transferase
MFQCIATHGKLNVVMPQLTVRQAFELAAENHQAGKLRDAEAIYQQILVLQPKHAGAINGLGSIACQTGDFETGVDLIRRAVTLRPDYAAAYINLGNALSALGRWEEAIAAYLRAIDLDPRSARAYGNLGNACKDALQLDEAVASYESAIALEPGFSEAYSNLGNALSDKGQLDEAIAAYRRAIALHPDYVEAHSNLIYTLCYHPAYDANAIADEYRGWDRRHAVPLRKSIEPHRNSRDPNRRLRVGYVGADFREHCQSLFVLPLLSSHDKRQLEVFCYTNSAKVDARTSELRNHAHGWREIFHRSDPEVATIIGQDRIDILVDLTMHMAGNRLLTFARKPAPVQVTWLAYPGSTGLTAIDYRLSDPYLDPPGMDESVYSERTFRLPHCFWCFDPLEGREIPVNSLPAVQNGFVTFGCLNNFCKVNDQILALWAAVLRQVKDSRLLLLAAAGSHQKRTLDQFEQHGVERERVEFVLPRPRRQYLQLYHRIDLGLDSYPYNGHTTSLDSFWMGVPVITLVGKTAVSRGGWCQLSNLGLTELAGQTSEQFVHIAVELANDLPRVAQLRSSLRRLLGQSPLMDALGFARNIESAYRQMWRSWCQND